MTVLPIPPRGSYSTVELTYIYLPLDDPDSDGLPRAWEVRFGLDPDSAEGDDGATGDPDHDGKTNLQEYQADTHPQGFFTRYFAEGATSGFYKTSSRVPRRFLILVFAALPAVVQAQSVDFAWWEDIWGPPAFLQPVAVGEVLTGLRLGYCQYGILRLTPATDGMLRQRSRSVPGSIDQRFGALIESQGPTPAQLVVERSMYWNASGQFWAAGTNSLATRLQ